MKRRLSLLLICILLLMFFLNILASQYFSLPTGQAILDSGIEEIKIGHVPSSAGSVMFIGMERGYFEEAGIKITTIPYKTGKYTVESLTRGDIDIALSVSISARMFNAYARGAPIRLVAGQTLDAPWISVRKELWDDGVITGISDLKGKRISVSSEGSGSYYGVAYLLQKEGLDIKEDVELAYLGQQEMTAALEAGSIDVATLRPPYLTAAIENGLVVLLPDTEKYFYPNIGYQRSAIFASEDFINEKPETLKRFLEAYNKSVEIYYNAYHNVEPYRTEAVKVISDLTGIDEEAVDKDIWIYHPPTIVPDSDSIQEIYEYYLARGVIEEPIDLDEFIYPIELD